MFERLARLINRSPWVIVGIAIALAAIGGIFGGPVAKSLQVGGFQDPSSQSTVAVAPDSAFASQPGPLAG